MKKAASSNEEEEFMNWLVWMITVDAHKTHTHRHGRTSTRQEAKEEEQAAAWSSPSS